ncbi:hypothetical protein BSL78_13135 [Apostichopus japonicus]|uniref:Ubiquitin-like domain-containing protein n=1 Tax=Stichopus japonicus TaxID=307972 RepID=A0A2G8KPP5_STIJA|nr:hypothetical protein BSL78_13135 [Apostichopus japonicus]
MLLYIESSAFVVHTFIVQCTQTETLARVRAKLLHLLYDMGRENHQFRLRFKGQFLRDSYTLDDYRIGDRCIVKMIPMSKRSEGSLYVSWLFVLFAFFTTYWYAGIWNFIVTLYAVLRCPTYTHRGGFVGTSSLWPRRFMIIFAVLMLLNWGATVALTVLSFLSIFQFDCVDNPDTASSTTNSCSSQYVGHIYSMVFFVIHAIYLFGVCTTALTLLKNFGFLVGDYLEKYLVITRDVEKVIQAARSSRVKEQRTAAFELATLSTTGDDSKFRIVAEGGLEVLISLGLSRDESTQEYATEAMAELLTVPAIQDQFVEAGGVTTLSTILHSQNKRLVQEAATALSYIVADSDENKQVVAAERGLEDLSHAAKNGSEVTQRCIAGIFLDLAFSPEIRSQMASMNSPTSALVTLCSSGDPETLRLSLQTLELIAIESPDVILYHEDLLEHLLNVTKLSLDASIYLLAGKIILYFAESPDSCTQLLAKENLKDTLMRFVKTDDATLQKVVCKIILCMLEEKVLMLRAKEQGLRDIFHYVSKHAGDRDAWNMADEGITVMDGSTVSKVYPSTSSETMGSTSSLKKKASSTDSVDKKTLGSLSSLNKMAPSGSKDPMGSISNLKRKELSEESVDKKSLGSSSSLDKTAAGGSEDRTGSVSSLQKAKMGSQSSLSSRGN